MPPVLPGLGHPHGVHLRVAEHARQRRHCRLIEVGLVLIRVLRRPSRDRVPLRRPFTQPADGPAVVRVDLVVEPDKRVPVGAILRDREVQVRPRVEHARPVRVVHLAFQAEEEVHLVPDDGPADDPAPLAFLGRRLRQVPRPDEVVLGDPRVVRQVPEHHALELVGAGLGDRIDHRAAGPAELGVVHAGQYLELLDGLQRRPHLRSRARPQRIVGVVAAIDRDVVVLGRLAGGDDGVVAHLVRRRELHARQQRHGGEVVAVDGRQLAELGGADVAPDANRRGIDERRFARDRDRLLEAPMTSVRLTARVVPTCTTSPLCSTGRNPVERAETR